MDETIYRLLAVQGDRARHRCWPAWRDSLPPTFHVALAASPRQGLDALRDGNFDCVLLDFGDETDGAAGFLKAASDPAGTLPCAVLAVVPAAMEATGVEAIALGGRGYLIREDMTAARLAHTIPRVIHRWRLEARSVAAAPSIAGRAIRVLIIDDSPIDQRYYKRCLERHPGRSYTLTQAAAGSDGLDLLNSHEFDCILLDFQLPDMSGIQFLAALANNLDLPPAATILITGQGNIDIAVEAMRLGARDYLVKSDFTSEQLARAIDRAVEQEALRQRLMRSVEEISMANAALAREVAVRNAAEAALLEAKNAAEQANLAKSRFVALISHELRTPLNGILGYTELLQLEGDLSPLQEARVRAMTRAGAHLLELIERVLTFREMEAGRVEPRPTHIAVRAVAENCIECAGPLAAGKGLDLRLVLDPSRPEWLMTDPGLLRQIVLNLLGNAIKFTDAGGVEIRLLAASGGGFLLEIADTGPGIPAEAQDRLFREFERVKPESQREGAGLGLAISIGIARAMGGTMGYRPNPRGGSIFWLELPPAAILDTPPVPDLAARPAAAPDKALHVLVVDDLPMNRDIVGAMLRSAGHRVSTAENGHEAWQAAAETGFDVILMDVLMPVMDGLEATRRIRSLPGAQGQVPIAGLTAHSFAEEIAKCRAAGMNTHIGKPVSRDALVHAIQELATRRAPPPRPPAKETAPSIALGLPLVDSAVLQQVTGYLSPEMASSTMDLLAARGEALLKDLRRPGHRTGEAARLAASAHTLAGGAGMLGFKRLAAMANAFEHAFEAQSPGAPDLARQLDEIIVATLPEIRRAAPVMVDTLARAS